jgi:hypothetical protein
VKWVFIEFQMNQCFNRASGLACCLLVPFLRRVLWRTLFSTDRYSFQAMLRVTLSRAVRAIPMIVKARRLGVRLHMILQVADEVVCRVACASYCFTAFSAQGTRLDFATLDRLFDESLAINDHRTSEVKNV